MSESTLEPRMVPLGGQRALLVRRTLPHRDVRMIGAFCFVDHYGPARTTEPEGHPMVVPPHPHTGLQTVSWLLSGTIDHHDSVGSIQRVRPGELNLMTAGHGIAHSEYSVGDSPLHGLQLWVALPDEARHQEAHFEHHGDLPNLDDSGISLRVVLGQWAGEPSKALSYSPLVCAQITAEPGQHRLPLDPRFEYGVIPLEHDVVVDAIPVPHAALRHLATGRTNVSIDVEQPTSILVIGGEPFTEDLLMWWNFVGRSHDEIVDARGDWERGTRFGPVVEDANDRLLAPDIPTVRLKPRPPRRA